ncbi:MAG TPA: MEDS domain-containing protein [Kofleriaceae bacterium]|nr:MEDS domain-containing protein [Kofleriaceae bacterium]
MSDAHLEIPASPPRRATLAAHDHDGHDHSVQFYGSDAVLVEAVAHFFSAGLARGEPAVIIATEPHREAFQRRLASMGVDVAGAIERGVLAMLDADDTLALFMRDGRPDPERFRRAITPVIQAVSRAGSGPIRAYGEMVDVLWRAGRTDAALLLEELWNDLQQHHAFALHCAYRVGNLYKEGDVARICGTHGTVVAGAEDATASDGAGMTPELVVALTQEIAQRKEVEVALRRSLRDLRRTEAELIRRNEDLADFIDNAPVGVHAVGADGTILWANRRELEIVGYDAADYVGRPITAFHADADVIDSILRRLQRNEVLHDVPARLRARDGSIRHVLISSNARIEDGHLAHTRCFTRDVTAAVRYQVERDLATGRNERLLRITAAIAEAIEPAEVHEAVVDQVVGALGAATGGLWLLDEDTGRVALVRCVGYTGAIRQFDSVPLDSPVRFPALDTIRDGVPMWLSSQAELLARYPHVAAAVTPGRTYEIACLPIAVAGRVVGTLAFTFEAGRALDEDARAFLSLVARYSSQALERLRLHIENRRGRQRAELLYQLARAVIEAKCVADVHEAALDAIARALDAPRASVLTFDGGGAMRFVAARGLSEEYRRAVDGHSPWARDEREPQPILVADTEASPAMAGYLPVFRAEGIRALAFFPLVAGGKLLGKFMVYYGAPRVLSDEEVAMAAAIANHVGAAIDRFDATGQLERTVRFNEMFTAILGHDLRNPLAAITTAAQLLLSRTEDEQMSRPLSRILSSGDRMARMIGQLLDFTRVRVGQGIPLEPTSTDLEPVLRQVMDELAEAHPGVEMPLVAHGDLTGRWDPDRLSQVFSNLLGNAVQHGKGGRVSVTIDGRAPGQVAIAIHNDAVIAEERIPRLFEPMTGAEERCDRTQGLGLGLFISRQIACGHGGDLTVRSTAGAGTTFTVVLPRSAAS